MNWPTGILAVAISLSLLPAARIPLAKAASLQQSIADESTVVREFDLHARTQQGVAQEFSLPSAFDQEGASIPVKDSAVEQLKFALVVKRQLRGARGSARSKARRRAVEAYRAVRRNFPRDYEVAAEGAFRAGELLRSAGEWELAIAEFEHARVLGRKGGFGPRAGLEIGHIERRRGRMNAALSSYEAVQSLGESCARERDLATYWAGRVHATLERPLDAARCYERAARQGVDPLQRTRAFDAWANALIDGQDLEGAAGVLELCRESLRAQAQEESQLGVRLRACMEAMKSTPRLKREIEARRKSSSTEPPARTLRVRSSRTDSTWMWSPMLGGG